MAASFLERILADKAREVETAQARAPLAALEKRIAAQAAPRDFAAALRGDGVRLIAEVKKASPSKGLLAPDFDPVRLAKAYAHAGAAAISVLTDAPYFQGSLDHLVAIREALGQRCPPLLRKDFIIDPYQVYQARAYGSDALLLIVVALEQVQLSKLLRLTRELGMEALVEVHTEAEAVRAVDAGAKVIGINNRDLHSFKTDLAVTRALRPLIPADRIVVSESGIETAEHIAALRAQGIDAVLIGEALVKAKDPAAKVREMFGAQAGKKR
ncbi:MAG: indole-3-glycerol phosphate synthase TrpC [Chloroflexi bacterium]|nr:indole-3-glycerol phosphate synthase TrpC [Chloroflexota bacterium]